MIIHDQHVHCKYSADSNQELEPYFKAASELGCSYFVTTDHLDLDIASTNVDWTVDFNGLKKELKELHKKYPKITPLLGIEVGYREDLLDRINKQLNEEKFDLVNLSIHDNGYADFYFRKYFEKYGIDELMNSYFDEMIHATSTFFDYNVLSHLDYGFKTIYLMDNSFKLSRYEEKVKIVLKNIIKYGKALEINTKVQESINDINHTKYLLKLYKELGGERVTLSSDAHNVSRYYSSFEFYKKVIKECGFDHLVYYIKREEYKYNI